MTTKMPPASDAQIERAIGVFMKARPGYRFSDAELVDLSVIAVVTGRGQEMSLRFYDDFIAAVLRLDDCADPAQAAFLERLVVLGVIEPVTPRTRH